uniref:Adhesion G protein-coupled receptor E1-like n=1 Tax=Crassostrea virginica TaxID=6565 RepID=A0A8B8AJT1_CRAVI|nr:adhesion G protein-coupled receptor E1-like [Crassostrea virginica]
MRVLQILLLLTIVVGVKSDGAPFDECATDAQCPADATCIDTNNNDFNDRCSCNTDFFPYDTGVTVDGVPQTMCTPIVCDPTDPNQCSGNGDCEVEGGRYVCDCYEGFTGEICEMPITTTTPTTTAKRRNVVPIVAAGAGLLFLALLGAGAAAASSG